MSDVIATSTLKITLPTEQWKQLKEMADDLGISLEDLVRLGLERLLKPDERVEQAASYVLEKNAELYRRLA